MLDDLIDYACVFAGVEAVIDLDLYNSIENSIIELLDKLDIESVLPFFTLDEPFRKFLIRLSWGDGKMNSIFNKIKVGENFGLEIVQELISSNIITIQKSREEPIALYPKQMIKKELRAYEIQPKLYFTKPFYRFWFNFAEPNRDAYGNINKEKVLEDYKNYSFKLSSLLFEQLSIELLELKFRRKNQELKICGSYWDRFSEFDIYCNSKNASVVGECKYTNRPITKAELTKLESKIIQSSLKADYIALFSKSGFSHELEKQQSDNLLLFSLKDFREIL